jgi:hypothetical protein
MKALNVEIHASSGIYPNVIKVHSKQAQTWILFVEKKESKVWQKVILWKMQLNKQIQIYVVSLPSQPIFWDMTMERPKAQKKAIGSKSGNFSQLSFL